MYWSRTWEGRAQTVPGLLGLLPACSPQTVTAWGETAEPVADWLSALPGEIEAEVSWPRAPQDTPSLVALLSLADLRELDVRSGVETRMRWWGPGRLQIRAPREALFWAGLEERFRRRETVSERIQWLQGHRRHDAWSTGGLSGLEMTDGRGYREWTVVADELPAAELLDEIRALAPHRLSARVANMRPRHLDLPREPARVRRWFIRWEGEEAPDPRQSPGLRPSWHFHWSRPYIWRGTQVEWEETGVLGRPPVERLNVRVVPASGLQDSVRQVARSAPAGRSWWHTDALSLNPAGMYAVWAGRAAAHQAFQELGRPVLRHGDEAGPGWWRRWPGTDDRVWLASHPRWPEQAFVARYPAVGPYAGRIELRWGWHGPRWLYPAGDVRADLRCLSASGPALEAWWEALSDRAPTTL